MDEFKMHRKKLIMVLISLCITACGGGSGSGTVENTLPPAPAPAPTILKGAFFDSAVEGLNNNLLRPVVDLIRSISNRSSNVRLMLRSKLL